MGVVWEASDERLGRRVAVKRHRFAEGDPSRRERLRREAQTVAQLSHPAIVQIFDIVEHDDSDWIVMELVPGDSLAKRLRRGPLAIEDALTLAHDVAEGLAEAHGKGFLHRDLKAENVLVTPAGRAKILDFGLAKAVQPSGDETQLTETDELVGTYRAMSPEQIHGLELDPRSDLFSFGILLYEMVTGVSPFRAASDAETLDRICRFQQTPASELNADLPPVLSQLIDELLGKQREWRPATARAVAARLSQIFPVRPLQTEEAVDGELHEVSTVDGTPAPSRIPVAGRRWPWVALLLLAAGMALAAGLWRRGGESRVVAMAPVTVGVGQEREEVGLAAAAVRAAGLRTLVGLAGLQPVTADDKTPAAAGPEALARLLAADEVLAPRLDCAAGACQLSLERRGSDGQVIRVETVEVPVADLSVAATAVSAAIQRVYPRQRWRRGLAKLTVEPADYARYLEIERAYRTRAEDWTFGRGIAELAVLRRRSPRFLEAYLLEATLRSDQHYDSRDSKDLEAGFALLEEARELAPDDPRVAHALFTAALDRGRLEEASAALAELERLAPGDTRTLMCRGHLAERRGEGQLALESIRRAAARRPSWRNLLFLANLEIRQGEIPAARRTLTDTRSRFPDDLESLSMLAQLELLAGDAERAVELYGELVAHTPRFADLTNLGTAKLLLGRYAAAAESFRRALELVPSNPGAVLNLADAELMLGNGEEARQLYQRVVELIAADPAAEGLWQWLCVRAQALAHLGAAQEAVTAVRRAEQLAPRNPQVAYEAALVYAVVGDETSALVSAEKAIQGGVEAHWFGFPWFAALRAEPAFAKLLSSPAPD